MATTVTFTSPQDVRLSESILSGQGFIAISRAEAQVDGDNKMSYNSMLDGTHEMLCNLLYNDQTRLYEILDSDDSDEDKLIVITKEGVETGDYNK
jgi:hypothetical protein